MSSFGAGGSNAHIILEEYVDVTGENSDPSTLDARHPILIVLSAKNRERLKEVAHNFYAFLKKSVSENDSRFSALDLRSMAYTLQVGREAMEERMALVVNDREELLKQLLSYLQDEPLPGTFTGKNLEGVEQRIFSGYTGQKVME